MPGLYSGASLPVYANRVITASAELRTSGVTQEGSTNYRVPPLTKDLWNAIMAELVSVFPHATTPFLTGCAMGSQQGDNRM